MKVFALQQAHYDTIDLCGLFATRELAENHMEYVIRMMYGKKADKNAYLRMFSITEMEVEGA